jgi:Ca2+-binding EF-hand superfamily protein
MLMSSISVHRLAVFVLLAACTVAAGADDKAEYDRRAAARYTMLFQSLDRNADGTVTRLEAQGDLNFYPRFDDMDIDRDGVVTLAELRRFIEQEHGASSNLVLR